MDIVYTIDFNGNIKLLDNEKRIYNYMYLINIVFGIPTVQFFETVSLKNVKSTVDDILLELTEREEEVLRLSFGLDDGNPRTLEEISSEFHISVERVCQIEAKSLRRMKHPSHSARLKKILFPACFAEKSVFEKLFLEEMINYILYSRSGIVENTFSKMGYTVEVKKDPSVIFGTPDSSYYNEELLISDLDFSTRAFHCLSNAGYTHVSELFRLTDDDYLNMRNMGRKTLEEIKSKLSMYSNTVCSSPSVIIKLTKNNTTEILNYYSTNITEIVMSVLSHLNTSFIFDRECSDEIKTAAMELGYTAAELFETHMDEILQKAEKYSSHYHNDNNGYLSVNDVQKHELFINKVCIQDDVSDSRLNEILLNEFLSSCEIKNVQDLKNHYYQSDVIHFGEDLNRAAKYMINEDRIRSDLKDYKEGNDLLSSEALEAILNRYKISDYYCDSLDSYLKSIDLDFVDSADSSDSDEDNDDLFDDDLSGYLDLYDE